MRRRWLLPLGLAAVLAAEAAAEKVSVAGVYPTKATLIEGSNTCGEVTVRDNPTTVEHAAGAKEIALTHAGQRYEGSIDRSGQFNTAEKVLKAEDTEYRITIRGQFADDTLTAEVEIHQKSPAKECGYVVRWEGKKE